MFDLGIQELIVIFVVALLVFGPKRLPELASNIGKMMGHLKKAMFDIRQEIDSETRDITGVDLNSLPSWQAENLKKSMQGKALDAMGLGDLNGVNPPVDEEEGAPRREPVPDEDAEDSASAEPPAGGEPAESGSMPPEEDRPARDEEEEG